MKAAVRARSGNLINHLISAVILFFLFSGLNVCGISPLANDAWAQLARGGTNISAKAEIPIELPKNYAGLAPMVNLTYDSLGGGTSWLGQGWNLEWGSIQKKAERFYFVQGNFVDELIQTSESSNGSIHYYNYHLRHNEKAVFTKTINHYDVKDHVHWDAQIGGLTYLFGGVNYYNDAYEYGSDPTGLYDGRSALMNIKDKYGNQLTFLYYGKVNGHIQLGKIQCGSAGKTAYEIKFTMDTDSADPSRNTLHSIDIYTPYNSAKPASTYEMKYDKGTGGNYKLTSVTRSGYDDNGKSSSQPPIVIGWYDKPFTNINYDYLKSINNGQGGTVTYTYDSITLSGIQLPRLTKTATNSGLYNNQMVTTYSYTGAKVCNSAIYAAKVTETRPDETTLTTDYYNTNCNCYFGAITSFTDTRGIATQTVTNHWQNWHSGKFPYVQSRDITYNTANPGTSLTLTEAYTYSSSSNNSPKDHLLKKVVRTNLADTSKMTIQYDWAQPQSSSSYWWKISEVKVYEGADSTKLSRWTKYSYFPQGGVQFEDVYRNASNYSRTTYAYDAVGNLTSITDPLSNVTTITYDPTDTLYPTQITRPSTNGINHKTGFTYNLRCSKPATITDENSNITTNTYDPFCRLIQVTHPDAGVDYFNYTNYADYTNPASVQVSKNFPGPNNTPVKYLIETQYFDGYGRLAATAVRGTDHHIVTKNYYDEKGQLFKKQGPYYSDNPFGNPTAYDVASTTFTYNPQNGMLSQEIQTLDEGTAVTAYNYDQLLCRKITDPDNNEKTQCFDPFGRGIKTVTEKMESGETTAEYTTSYGYNSAGDMTSITSDNPFQKDITMQYDLRGKTTKMTDTTRGTWNYQYYDNGSLKSLIGPKDAQQRSNVVDFKYDALNRITEKNGSTKTCDSTFTTCSTVSSSTRTTYKYDKNPYNGAEIPNGRGRLTQINSYIDPANLTDDNKIIRDAIVSYDVMGRVTSSARRYATENNLTKTISKGFDFAGRLTAITYPDNTAVTYKYYEGTDIPLNIKFNPTPTNPATAITIADYKDYSPFGQARDIPYHYHQEIRTIDPYTGQLSGYELSEAGTGNIIQKKTYKYYPSGDMKTIEYPLNNYAYGYQYYLGHRLDMETKDIGGVGQLDSNSYTYDSAGNFTANSINSNLYTFTYDPISKKNQVKNITINSGATKDYAYDSRGNVFTAPNLIDTTTYRSIDYNDEGKTTQIQLKQMSNNTVTKTVKLYYDGMGLRAQKVVSPQNGATKTFYFGPHYEIEKNSTATTNAKYILAGSKRIAKVDQNGIITYLFKDHLGSTTVAANGSTNSQTDYIPFGPFRQYDPEISPSTTNYEYTGQEHDTDTGLYYYKSRYYDPILGRFLSPDTIIPDPFDPQSLNSYSYVLNNPMNYTDPTGHGPGDPGECQHKGCHYKVGPNNKSGYCSEHINLYKLDGGKRPIKCGHEGCERYISKGSSSGYCIAHYKQHKRLPYHPSMWYTYNGPQSAFVVDGGCAAAPLVAVPLAGPPANQGQDDQNTLQANYDRILRATGQNIAHTFHIPPPYTLNIMFPPSINAYFRNIMLLLIINYVLQLQPPH